MSHSAAHAAIDDLRRRWEAEGFVAKDKLHLARPVANGLHIVAIGGPGSWRTAITVTYAVWLAPFAARTIGKPVPWPAKRFKLPEENTWHDSVSHAELAGAPRMYVEAIGAAPRVWTQWPAADRWLRDRTEFATLAARAIADGHASTLSGWRRFQIAALCFLELGQSERALEMMEVERQYFHRPDVSDGHPPERVLGWWARSATFWREVAGLRAPELDGRAGPEVPAARTPAPVRERPRASIWYASQLSGEWMKTRASAVAIAKVERLLAYTTFAQWDQAELRIHADPVPEFDRLEADVQGVWRDPPHLDDAALAGYGISPEPRLADALARFGPAQWRTWASSGSARADSWRGRSSYYFWKQPTCGVPADWLAFCDAHRDATIEERARVEFELEVAGLDWLASPGGARLPAQGSTFYPPTEYASSWPATSSVRLALPACKLTLRARLPFEDAGDAFRRYRDALAEALGYVLAPSHFCALLINQAGTGVYDRKLAKRA